MYTVLLADDEESVLTILKSSIDWQGLGVDTLLTAANGQIALELLSQRTIDLLVTDIRMPILDGIELIRRVRAIYPDTHCVLLTAYGEFQYAQEAIRLGVDNYLLKPVAREEVIQTIHSALDNIYQKRNNRENLLKENTLRRWATGSISAEELGERASVLGMNLYCPNYCVLCLTARNGATLTSCRASVTALLQLQCQCEGFWDEKGRYVLILCGKALDLNAFTAQIRELAEYEKMGGKIKMAFGTVVDQYDLLLTSYQAASDALETANLSAQQVIAPPNAEALSFDADLLAEEIRSILYDTPRENYDAQFRHFAGKLYSHGWDGSAFSRLCRSGIHVLMQEFPMQTGLPEQVYAFCESIPRPQDAVSGRLAAELFLQKLRPLFFQEFGRYNPMVQHMIRAVRTGVRTGEGASIKELAANAGVTPAYLGHLFKQETGIFFNDYLLHCRLDRSIVLLRNPNRKIKDIAETVGFTSTSYYVKCFREYKGTSPAKYRLTWNNQPQEEF